MTPRMPRQPAATARKSHSCGQGAPGFNTTGRHRQVRTSLWPALLGTLGGTVLELGPGSGANLGCYPPGVRWLGIEPDRTARDRTRREAARLGLHAQVLPGRAEELELDDATVDAVVCSFVLCSVTEPNRVLAEIRRVLTPRGRFLFAEHVASARGTWPRRVQNLLANLPTRCRPNRETERAITDAGFTLVDVHRFVRPGPWGLGVPHLAGCAQPSKGQS